MVSTSKEIARRFEEQSRVQNVQQEMFQVQQESLNDLKKMIVLWLQKQKKKSKSSRPGTSSSKSKGKEKVVESCISENTDGENNFEYEIPKSLFEEKENSENEDN